MPGHTETDFEQVTGGHLVGAAWLAIMAPEVAL